ncbi:MAG TPA: M4 family metallopeptidase [Ideonella sp.]|uniref:M4 family metallopeptidase n=1 Tax=Ideonella sp. TaxID=1929293 RepID=UPI002CB26349|nr:M4 family metallopeptidase [Ideonella sp.]HSI48246.1 M4 family metallopeptidase [Ideonella sp.]
MKPTAPSSAILRATVAGVAALLSAQMAQAAMPQPDHPAVQRALAHLNGSAFAAVRATGNDDYQATDLIVDADGSEHVRFKRAFRHLAVIGGDLVVHSGPGGEFSGLSQAPQRRLDLAVEPTLSGTAAEALALKTSGVADSAVRSRQLVIHARNGQAKLAWDVTVLGHDEAGGPARMRVIIDAHQASLLERWNEIHSADDTGTGKALYYGTVPLHDTVNKKGTKYTLQDNTRGKHYMVDMNGTQDTETVFTATENVWGDGTKTDRQTVAADAAYGQNMTWDFYKKVMGRNGIADDGNGAHSRVHFGTRVDNAYWDDECFCMMYGDGFIQFKPLVALDVAGHEMTHGVTSRTADLIYGDESGGLNESSSDILGTMVEFYANNAGDPGDYTLGEMIMKKPGTVLRYLYQPSKDNISADCWYQGVGNLNPHYSSGVSNHFFFLLAEGTASATFPASKTCTTGDTVKATGNGSLTGIGRDKAAKIWYRALTVYMVSTETHAMARADTIKAAEDLYGAGSPESLAVAAAWTAVNRP